MKTLAIALALVVGVGAQSLPLMAGGSDNALPSIVDAESGAWIVPAGSDLEEIIQAWARIDGKGWTVIWDDSVEKRYALRGSGRFEGDFKRAVADLIDNVARTYPELRAKISASERTILVFSDLASK